MKSKKSPLSLTQIKFNIYSPTSEMAKTFPAIYSFDGRHHFTADFTQSSLAVLLVFTNERTKYDEDVPGIRRNVSISLTDATEDCLIGITSLRVNIPKYHVTGTYRVDFPFAYANVKHDHSYKVTVRDDTTGNILGEDHIHIFDEHKCGQFVNEWFEVVSAGVAPEYGETLLKSIRATPMTYQKVRFNICSNFRVSPFIMPEMEVRVHFHNGEIASQFCKMKSDDYDDEPKDYYIEMLFYAHEYNIGICYAEIICMDIPLAGIIFSASENVEGIWEGNNLQCLDEYSLSEATDRYRKSFIEPSTDDSDGISSNPDNADDDFSESMNNQEFEDALNNFIASEIGYSEDEIEGEEDVSDDEDNIDEEVIDDNKEHTIEISEENECADSHKSSIDALSSLTGLQNVKEKLFKYEKLVKFNKKRIDLGLPAPSLPLHAMFLGSPGTGKTTVAKMMGKMFAEVGVLSKGHVIVKERATLLGPNYSNEETNTLKAIEDAKGGILLIDEAYQLFQPNDPRDPGKFVIETLLTALADESDRDWMLILAGYPEEMMRMFDMNPGFKSRIPASNIYHFEDFSEMELMEIAECYLTNNGFSFTPDAREALQQRLRYDISVKDKNFGNARHVMTMIQTEILPAMAVRVMGSEMIDEVALSEIHSEDIPFPTLINQARTHIGFRA